MSSVKIQASTSQWHFNFISKNVFNSRNVWALTASLYWGDIYKGLNSIVLAANVYESSTEVFWGQGLEKKPLREACIRSSSFCITCLWVGNSCWPNDKNMVSVLVSYFYCVWVYNIYSKKPVWYKPWGNSLYLLSWMSTVTTVNVNKMFAFSLDETDPFTLFVWGSNNIL